MSFYKHVWYIRFSHELKIMKFDNNVNCLFIISFMYDLSNITRVSNIYYIPISSIRNKWWWHFDFPYLSSLNMHHHYFSTASFSLKHMSYILKMAKILANLFISHTTKYTVMISYTSCHACWTAEIKQPHIHQVILFLQKHIKSHKYFHLLTCLLHISLLLTKTPQHLIRYLAMGCYILTAHSPILSAINPDSWTVTFIFYLDLGEGHYSKELPDEISQHLMEINKRAMLTWNVQPFIQLILLKLVIFCLDLGEGYYPKE